MTSIKRLGRRQTDDLSSRSPAKMNEYAERQQEQTRTLISFSLFSLHIRHHKTRTAHSLHMGGAATSKRTLLLAFGPSHPLIPTLVLPDSSFYLCLNWHVLLVDTIYFPILPFFGVFFRLLSKPRFGIPSDLPTLLVPTSTSGPCRVLPSFLSTSLCASHLIRYRYRLQFWNVDKYTPIITASDQRLKRTMHATSIPGSNDQEPIRLKD
jgi:hypothetical protein